MQTYKDAYDEMLDEVYPTITLGNLIFQPSRVIEELDPTAYRCGFSEWTDSMTCQGCGNEFSADAHQDDEYAPVCPACAEKAESET